MSSAFTFGQNQDIDIEQTDNSPILLLNKGKYFTTYKVKIGIRWYIRKQLSVEFINSELHRNLLKKEFEIGQQLDHPNIVKYLFMNNNDKDLHLFMDYIDGATIQTLIDNNDKVLKKDTAFFIKNLTNQLSGAFNYIHGKGIYHGDISPANVIYNREQKKFYLIDLGFAATENYIALGGGTPYFASPEAFLKPHRINATSDIFSYGKIIEQISFHTKFSNYNYIIARCCETDQKDRYQDFNDVAKAIAKIGVKQTLRVSIVVIALMCLFFTTLFLYKKDKHDLRPIVVRKTEPILKQKQVLKDTGTTSMLPKLFNSEGMANHKIATPIILSKIKANQTWIDTIVNKYDFLKLFKERISNKDILFDMQTMRDIRNHCIVETHRQYSSFVEKAGLSDKDKQLLEDAYNKNYFHEYLKSDTIMKNRINDLH